MNNDDDMEAVSQALAHESRRRMLDIIKSAPGASVGEIARGFDVSRIAVMKHLAVLEAANLILSQKDGRVRRLYFNPVPIQMIHERWSDEYSEYWSSKLSSIKYRAESRHQQTNKKERD